MKLIIGLGNPGKQYENTRHNAGFLILDELQKKLEFPEFKLEKKFSAFVTEKNIAGEKIFFAKPETFMNLSGKAVSALANFYKILPEEITLIHDDLDIEIGKYKISNDSSAAGHNGVQSVFDEFGTQKIKRIRIGIEGAENKKTRLLSGSDFVLQAFSQADLEIIKKLADTLAKEI